MSLWSVLLGDGGGIGAFLVVAVIYLMVTGAVRGGLHAPIWANWDLTGGADLAVTFVGPRRGRILPQAPRPPAPGNGIVLFGARGAVQSAEWSA